MRRRKKREKTYMMFKYGSIGAVLCNLSASTLGCSVLCIPYVFSLCGWLYGFIIICVIVLLQLISMRLLLQCQKCTGVRSIQQLTILYLKNKCGVLFINIIIFGFCFTQCIAILIALADLIQPVFKEYLKDSFLANRSFLLIVVTLFVLLPLSFKDKPPHLRISNKHSHGKKIKYNPMKVTRFRDSLYNICMIYFLFAISIACLIRFCADGDHPDISFDSVGIHTGIYINKSSTVLHQFYSLSMGWSIILFSLTTHIQLFKVNEKLSNENKSKLYSISHGILITTTIYILLLGTCGYFYFSDNPNVETNIITNLKDESKNDILILIAMIIIGIAMFLFYPTVLEPSRHSMSILIFPAQKYINITQHILLTFFVDIFALIVSLFIKDLATLFAWSGAIFASILCLILPGLLFWNIIVFPSKTFVQAINQQNKSNINKRQKRKLSALKKYNLNNSSSKLNSIIATATPPLMNYARNVNEDGNQFEDRSSMLSGSQLSSLIHNNTNNSNNQLPNIMTPDAFNQVIAESYDRLYGGGVTKKSVLMAIQDDDDDDTDEKYYNEDDDTFDSRSPTIDTKTPSMMSNKMIEASDYEEQIMINNKGNKGNKRNKNKNKEWWKHKMEIKRGKGSQTREMSQSRTINQSQSRTNNLREASRTIQEKIEQQLNEEKMQRIKTLEKANQSWIFWFDRVGAVLLLISGLVLFVIGNFSNIAHIVDQYNT